MVKAHFVNHTHWDREWYFTTQDAQVLSDQLFTDVLTELEKHPEANFTLDGQMSIVDEYVEIHPEAKERIRKLVARNQLFIGPWYTQTDAMIPTAESLLRNLVIGINDARINYGKAMMLGYLPDTFGFNANLPMILHQVGIHDFLSWRGTNFKRQAKSPYFKWKSLGNKIVFVANFPLGYYTGQIDLASKYNLKEFVENRLDKGIKFETENGNHDEVLIPSGIDQMNIIHNISDTLKEVNKYSKHDVVISTYPKFMKTLRNKKLNEYQGELRLPTYSRVHRTIPSVRSKNKRKNFALEQAVLRRLEPLMIIAKKSGIKVDNGIIIKLWKEIFKLQPHDTLGGSVTDNVQVDIEHRFKQAFEIVDGVENYIKKRIAQRLKLTNHDVLVFNTDAHHINTFKTIEIISPTKDISFPNQYDAIIVKSEYTPSRPNIMQLTPRGYEFKDEPGYYKLFIKIKVDMDGLGYKVISFKDSGTPLAELEPKQGYSITNGDITLEFKENKFDLITQEKRFSEVISIYDQGNDGDTYDFSPLRGDKEIKLDWNGKLTKEVSKDIERLILSGIWKLPRSLEDRLSNKDLVNVDYQLILSFDKNKKVLSGKLVIDNEALSHRLRLKVKTGLETEYAHAQIQGGFRKTKNEDIAEDWNKEFVEKPVNIYIFDKTVGLNNGKLGLYFLGKGQKEYEKVGDSLYITLMATTGQLGKPNLLWRPGRASGDTTSVGHTMMPTPLAEELGKNTFEFGLLYLNKDELTEKNIDSKVKEWLSPSISYQIQQYNLFMNRLDNKIWDIEFPSNLPELKQTESWLTLSNNISISSIYLAYTVKNAIVIRIENLTNKTVDLAEMKEYGCVPVNALEEKQDDSFKVEPYDMQSFLVRID